MNHDAPIICCCGHAKRMHLSGAGPCRLCRSCEKFHLVGEGHHLVFEVVLGVVLVALGSGVLMLALHWWRG